MIRGERRTGGGCLKPVLLAGFGLLFVMSGCLAIQSGAAVSGPAGAPNPSRQPVAGPPAQPPPPRAATWTGTLRVTDPGVNMSEQPPKVDTIGGTSTVRFDSGDGTLAVDGGGPVALWTEERDPTYEECVAQLGVQALGRREIQSIPYVRGQGLCVVTFADRAVAFVRGVSAVDGDAVQMRAVRWPH